MKNIEKLISSIDEYNEKINSLQEYKSKIESEKEFMDLARYEAEVKSIDEEVANIQSKIEKNTKLVKHYNYALDYLIELYELNDILEFNEPVDDRAEIENEVIEYTKKLEKHLGYLPENLIEELQADYVEYVDEEENAYYDDEKDTNEEKNEEQAQSNYFVKDIDENENVSDVYDFNGFEDDLIFDEVLKVFDKEREEFIKTRVFDEPDDLKAFIEKFDREKMRVYCKYAITKNIGIKTNKSEEVFQVEDLEEKPVQPRRAPIIVMLDLIDKIDIVEKDDKELHPTNIRIGSGFQKELKETDLLYNVVHIAPEIVYIENLETDEFIESAEMTSENIRRINVLVDRVNKLSQENLSRVYEEYFREKEDRKVSTILEIVLREKYYENN